MTDLAGALEAAFAEVERQRAQRDNAIRALVKNGASRTRVAKRFGLSRQRVAQILSEAPAYAIPVAPPQAPHYADIARRDDAIRAKLAMGHTQRVVAQYFGLTQARISQIAKEAPVVRPVVITSPVTLSAEDRAYVAAKSQQADKLRNEKIRHYAAQGLDLQTLANRYGLPLEQVNRIVKEGEEQ